ncbi:hypothetical protein [Lysobacter sp. P5_B9]
MDGRYYVIEVNTARHWRQARAAANSRPRRGELAQWWGRTRRSAL